MLVNEIYDADALTSQDYKLMLFYILEGYVQAMVLQWKKKNKKNIFSKFWRFEVPMIWNSSKVQIHIQFSTTFMGGGLL